MQAGTIGRFAKHRVSSVVVAVLNLAGLAAPALVGGAQLLSSDGPSPASGHAAVIAQEVSTMPATDLAWRIVEDRAEPIDVAAFEERALGFVVAAEEAIVLTDASGTQKRLARGEAAFVPADVSQMRASLTNELVPYDRIGLVSPDFAEDAGGDRLLFASESFRGPDSSLGSDLDLVRDVLAEGESTVLPETGFPTLIFATNGIVDLNVGATDRIRLGAGEAATVTGEVEVVAQGQGTASFVAAMIGPDVPAPPTPPVGSIALQVRGCQPGIDFAEASNAAFDVGVIGECAPVELLADPVLLANERELTPSEADPGNGTYT